RKLEQGDTLALGQSISARVEKRGEAGEIELHFDLSGTDLDTALSAEGEIPLPPYIAGKRAPDHRDASDYQTMFAKDAASVAAPTAGLHFTPELFEKLRANSVGCE